MLVLPTLDPLEHRETPRGMPRAGRTLLDAMGVFAPNGPQKTPERQNLTRVRRKRPGFFLIANPCDIDARKRETVEGSGKNSKNALATICLTMRETLGIYRAEKTPFGASYGFLRSIQDLRRKRHKNITRKPVSCDTRIWNAVKTGETMSQGLHQGRRHA